MKEIIKIFGGICIMAIVTLLFGRFGTHDILADMLIGNMVGWIAMIGFVASFERG